MKFGLLAFQSGHLSCPSPHFLRILWLNISYQLVLECLHEIPYNSIACKIDSLFDARIHYGILFTDTFLFTSSIFIFFSRGCTTFTLQFDIEDLVAPIVLEKPTKRCNIYNQILDKNKHSNLFSAPILLFQGHYNTIYVRILQKLGYRNWIFLPLNNYRVGEVERNKDFGLGGLC